MTHWRELITDGTPHEPVPQKEIMKTPHLLTSGAGETGQSGEVDVTRLEVIDASGRVFTRWNTKIEMMSFQDAGRTLKVFIAGVAASGETSPAPFGALSSDFRLLEAENLQLRRALDEARGRMPSTPPATTALREWVQHKPTCTFITSRQGPTPIPCNACSCGLDAADTGTTRSTAKGQTMTPLEQLLATWRERAQGHLKHGDAYRVGEGWALEQCADELAEALAAMKGPETHGFGCPLDGEVITGKCDHCCSHGWVASVQGGPCPECYQHPMAPALAAQAECIVNPISSRGCERGTKGCDVRHLSSDIRQAQSPSGDAGNLSEECIQTSDKWLPATTAPQDGTAFRAFGPTLHHADFNPWASVEACINGERFIGAVWDGQHDVWNTAFIEFTHWQPLPTGPDGAQANRGSDEQKEPDNRPPQANGSPDGD